MQRLITLTLALTLTACAVEPTPFSPGTEVAPPYGCIEYRKRGGHC